MAEAFRAQGYQVTVTPDGADGGVDLILDGFGGRILVQCKHWNAWKVGVKTVRELHGVVAAAAAHSGIVVTSGRFTQEARAFARGVAIDLLDGTDVARMLGRIAVPPDMARAPQATPYQPPPATPRCPRCGENMVVRVAKRGRSHGDKFWGCPRYPTCRGIVNEKPSPAATGISPYGPPPGTRPISGPQQPPRPRKARRRRRRGGSILGALFFAFIMVPLGLTWLGGTGDLAGGTDTEPLPVRSAPGGSSDFGPPEAAPNSDDADTSISLTAKPHHVALDVTGQRLFVTNREAKSITVVDLKTNTQVAEWPVERQPTGLAFDEANQELWVTNYNDASVTVLDLVGTPLATLTVGRGPNGIAIDPDRRVAFVVQSLDKTLTVIDMNSRKRMQTVDREGGSGIAVDPVAQKACVASIFNTLYCYDSSLKLVETAPSLGDVVAVDPVTHDWVGVSISSKRLEVLDAVTRERKSFTLGQAPTGLVIDPSTRLVYVVMPGTREILVAEPFA